MTTITDANIGEMTVRQRLDLIARLWDSIPDNETLEAPDWHMQEIERRLAAAKANPTAAIPWSEVKARLRSKP
jgi:putative addiction module component (TIGR02574 family)